jgi:hypothetical protein
MPLCQLADVVVSSDKNLNAKPSPAGLALLNYVLIVVILYGDGDHLLSRSLAKPGPKSSLV